MDGSPTTRQRALLLVAFTALVCGRMPGVLWYGRVWAEEGLFYQNAWTLPPGRALFTEYGGYLNLVANAGGVMARYLVPLVDAPVVLTGLGLLFQLCPAVLLVTSRASWLRSPVAMGAALLFLATSSLGEEVFLQTLHSQYHLTLCVALIMSLDVQAGAAIRWFRRGLLLLAPLCGMLAIVLLPLFVARVVADWARGQARERAIQCGLLLGGGLVQWGLFYSPAGGAALGRAATVWPGLLVQAMALRQVITPLVGLDAGTSIGDEIRERMIAGDTPLWTVAVLAATVAGLGWASLRRWRSGAPWLLVSALLLAAVSYYGALGGGTHLLSPDFGQRYTFVPDVLITWTLLAVAFAGRRAVASWTAGVFAGWVIVASLLVLPRSFADGFGTGPNWRAEVARWQADPSHAIKLWPSGWTMVLHADHSPAPLASKTYDHYDE